MKEREIFDKALAITAATERSQFLDEVCGDNERLRGHIEGLLLAHEDSGSFLQSPPVAASSLTLDQPITEKPGTQIGPYKLLQQIGEGGMGVVYMAEQKEPVERRVALKIIKPGMDSRQVIARFEAERQALAMMDHPNIAKVLDAGTTESGRPYFVMELVKGQPITQYCDEHHLTPRQRLELFLPVCQAIQHAHQKGIIHRDIKPTNILVAEYDQQAVPKVIDFGVAKAISQPLTEKTMFTGFGQLVGTLEYMSPEQAKVNQLDIDTRSDIYSLGVLLYELLTGSTPFDKHRLRSAAWDEMLRIIREEEAQKPSTRLSESSRHTPCAVDNSSRAPQGANGTRSVPTILASIAASRGTEPARLTKLIRGELDWIVMKALEKDRNRRYETANGFALDVQRYLADQPVQACPPSLGYRLKKFVRRNKGALAAATLVLFVLVLLGSGIGWAVRDREARQARAGGQIERILAEAEQLEREQKWPEALAAARRAEAVVAGGEADEESAGRVHSRLQDLEFIDRLERVRMLAAIWVEGNFDNASADREYARAFHEYGVNVDEMPVEIAVERLKTRPALGIPVATALDHWAQVRWSLRRDAAASKRLVTVARGIDPQPLRDRMRAMWGKSATEVGDETRRLAESVDVRAEHPVTLGILARRLWRMKQPDLAVRLLRDAQRAHPGDFWLNYTLAGCLAEQKDDEGAVRFYTAAVSVRPRATAALNNLGVKLDRQKKLDEAIATYRRALEIDPNFVYAHNGLSNALKDQDKLDEAVAHCRRAIELDPKAVYAHHNLGILLHECRKEYDKAVTAFRTAIELDPKHVDAHYSLGHALTDMGELDEAIVAYRRALEIDPDYVSAHIGLGLALAKQKKLGEAVRHYRRALELDPKNVNAHTNLGSALGRQGERDEAITHYRTALEIDPRNANAHGALGLNLAIQGKFAEAIPHYRTAIELKPKKASTHFLLGYALARMEKLDEAIDQFRTSLELDPMSAAAHDELGIALTNTDKPGEAVPHFRKVIELDPERPSAHFNLGNVLRDQKELDEAIACYKKAIELDPKYAAAYNNIGAALRNQGKLDEAIACLKKAIELDPERPGAHYNLGNALCDQKKLDEAIACYKKAIELDPKDAYAYSALGNALCGQKKLDEAIACLKKAIELDPEYVPAHVNLGVALRDQKKLDEAIACYKKAIELDSKNAIAHNNLGALLCDELGEYDQAIESFRKAIELDPKLASASNSLRFAQGMKGWSLVSSPDPKRGDPERAIEVVKRVVELDPRSAWALQCLGWVQYRLGDWRASIDSLERSCGLDNGGDCAQWVVIALAHAKLAAEDGLTDEAREHHKTEARRRYEQADKQIDSRWRARPRGGTFQAIWDFRAEARELMGVKESKK